MIENYLDDKFGMLAAHNTSISQTYCHKDGEQKNLIIKRIYIYIYIYYFIFNEIQLINK